MNHIAIKFYNNDDGDMQAALIDIVDLHYICKQGINKNTAIFEEILMAMKEAENEKEND